MKADMEVPVSVDLTKLDEQLRALRLLVSQIGFALDNYLASWPPSVENSQERRDA